jgi:hypothetical protein
MLPQVPTGDDLQGVGFQCRSRAMTIEDGPARNLLFEQLSAGTMARCAPTLREIKLDQGLRVVRRHCAIPEVFFPLDCVISRTYTAACGHSAEMGMIGFEGVAGVSVFLGGNLPAYDAVPHIGGRALAIKARSAKAMFKEDLRFQSAVLSYIHAMMQQISQVAVCNRLHSTEQRISRWILLTSDKARSKNLPLTHDTIAQLLGVRRESVTVALGRLQDSGAIQNARGMIEIISAPCLEAAACECYRVIKTESDACWRYDRNGHANTRYSH